MRYWLNFKCLESSKPFSWRKAWESVGVEPGESPRDDVLWLKKGKEAQGMIETDDIETFARRLAPNYLVTILGEAP